MIKIDSEKEKVPFIEKYKKPMSFTLYMLPLILVGAYVGVKYTFASISADDMANAVKQVGSESTLFLISVLQTVAYALIAAFFGYRAASKVGLLRDFGFDWEQTIDVIRWSVVGGFILSLDAFIFADKIPSLSEYYVELGHFDLTVWLASVFYGGVIEELLLRWFLMSMVSLLIWKVIYQDKSEAPEQAIIASNFVSAFLFAAGHLPITVAMFGGLTPLLLLRCFLLNGGAGLLFGRFYRKYGIQYAMLSHALFHVVSRTIWLIAF